MYKTSKLIAEKGLPEFFCDGSQTYSFNAEKIFQDLYMLGKSTKEFNGKTASELTNKTLAVIANHKQAKTIHRNDVHQVISDVLNMSGFGSAAQFVAQRQLLQA